MAQARATAEQISRLGTLTTCEVHIAPQSPSSDFGLFALITAVDALQISDALIKLGHRTGGYVPDLERYSGDENRTVVGEAYTVEVRLRISHPVLADGPCSTFISNRWSTPNALMRQSSKATL